MSEAVTRAVWHPLTGATIIAALGLVAGLAAVGAAFETASTGTGLSAFLALGAIAGFAVSGST